MSDEESEHQSPHSDPGYLASYREHIAHTRAHLAGLEGNHKLDANGSSHWSVAEQNIFFHGLCVYSRQRPDLIAQDIGTKTVVDVCEYINVLDEAVEEI